MIVQANTKEKYIQMMSLIQANICKRETYIPSDDLKKTWCEMYERDMKVNKGLMPFFDTVSGLVGLEENELTKTQKS